MKRELIRYYTAPKPVRKRLFLRNLEMPQISLLHILRIQAHYIPKWIWLFSASFFAAAWFVSRYWTDYALGSMMAVVPFLVMVSIAESMRSVTYGMQELELAAPFTLSNIVCARLVILGLADFVLLFAAALLIGENMLRNVVCLMVPYLLTAFGCFVIVRKIAGRENMAACAGFACAVSGIDLIFHKKGAFFYDERYFLLWLLLFLLLAVAVVCETRKTISIMRELA